MCDKLRKKCINPHQIAFPKRNNFVKLRQQITTKPKQTAIIIILPEAMCMICIHSCFQRVHVLNQNPKLENLILIAPPFIQTIPAQRLNFCSMGTLIKTFFAHHGICTCTPEHTNNLRQTNTHKCTTEHTQTFHGSFSSHLIIHSFSQCQTWAPWKAGTV